MKRYIGVKVVQAEPQVKDGVDGYKVVYPAEFGKPEYVSWCPKDVFEQHNRPTDSMPFGHALEACKQGKRIARKGWNGKNQYVFLVQKDAVQETALKYVDKELHDHYYCPVLCIKTTTNIQMGWLATQSDMLMDDWCIIE